MRPAGTNERTVPNGRVLPPTDHGSDLARKKLLENNAIKWKSGSVPLIVFCLIDVVICIITIK